MKKIVIVDFGGQYTHLIARRIRELGIYSEISLPNNFKIDNEIAGIIFSGGPQSVDKKDAYMIDFDITKTNIPILGICYGHQLIAFMENGTITSGKNKEYGFTKIKITDNSKIFDSIPSTQAVWMSHGDFVSKVSDDYVVTASSENIPVVAYRHKTKNIFGVQFHPEVTHTENGVQILDNFLKICNIKRDWNTNLYKDEIINTIKRKADGKKLLILLSGGVDSLVAFELCIKAVGTENVFAIHVDTGFMRKNESKDIINHLNRLGYKNLKLIHAEELFLKELKYAIEPEKKREIVGKLFVDIVQDEMKKLVDKDNWLLVQGTIYPDTIESGDAKNSAKIKTHHNRVKEIEDLIKQGKVIEPLKDLYKDEVRNLGLKLGIEEKLINRHPFPGPGLVIRVLCSNGMITDTLNTGELNKLLTNSKLEGKILPIKSVGVQGDFRTYRHPAVVWFKNHNDYDFNMLRNVSVKILNNLESVNRVIFSTEPIANFDLKKLYLTKDVLDKLRDIDFYLQNKMSDIKEIWQMPVVALPLFANEKQFFVMRPIKSVDAMTADIYTINYKELLNINSTLKKDYNIAGIFYDLTTKPPGTIEWE